MSVFSLGKLFMMNLMGRVLASEQLAMVTVYNRAMAEEGQSRNKFVKIFIINGNIAVYDEFSTYTGIAIYFSIIKFSKFVIF